MLNIPEYKEYGGETKIALMDNSSLAFMHELSQKSYPSDGILSVYDLILIPKWVMEEIEDSTYRSTYVEQLQAQGYDYMYSKVELSEAWVAGNLLLFTVFDGYLENKYHLTEGASFREHYDNLPDNTSIEIIEKSCYRIFKIIRNGIQHNLSNVNYNDGSYNISYCHRNTSYALQISKNGVRYLYTLIMNIIKGQIGGMYGKYRTSGHYDGIMYTLYTDMLKEITPISDDIGTSPSAIPNGLKLRAFVRYPVENPTILAEDATFITFHHIENNGTDDISCNQYNYSTDYIYKDYLLPQEIGIITKGKGDSVQERMKSATIRFEKSCIEDK